MPAATPWTVTIIASIITSIVLSSEVVSPSVVPVTVPRLIHGTHVLVRTPTPHASLRPSPHVLPPALTGSFRGPVITARGLGTGSSVRSSTVPLSLCGAPTLTLVIIILYRRGSA